MKNIIKGLFKKDDKIFQMQYKAFETVLQYMKYRDNILDISLEKIEAIRKFLKKRGVSLYISENISDRIYSDLVFIELNDNSIYNIEFLEKNSSNSARENDGGMRFLRKWNDFKMDYKTESIKKKRIKKTAE